MRQVPQPKAQRSWAAQYWSNFGCFETPFLEHSFAKIVYDEWFAVKIMFFSYMQAKKYCICEYTV